MTNGEKIKEIFPQAEITPQYVDMMLIGYEVGIDGESFFSDEWWDMEYEPSNSKKSNKSEIPTGSTTKNCESCRYYGSHHEVCNYCYKCSLWTETEPTTKNDLVVDCIDRAELLKAMDTYDKFGNDSNERLIFLSTPALQDRYVPYVHYDDMVNCVKGMSTVTPQPKKGHWIAVHPLQPNDEGDYMCSVCRCGGLTYKPTKFCPNCGVKMVEPQESENP